jgi:hypothetical protein
MLKTDWSITLANKEYARRKLTSDSPSTIVFEGGSFHPVVKNAQIWMCFPRDRSFGMEFPKFATSDFPLHDVEEKCCIIVSFSPSRL